MSLPPPQCFKTEQLEAKSAALLVLHEICRHYQFTKKEDRGVVDEILHMALPQVIIKLSLYYDPHATIHGVCWCLCVRQSMGALCGQVSTRRALSARASAGVCLLCVNGINGPHQRIDRMRPEAFSRVQAAWCDSAFAQPPQWQCMTGFLGHL